jgi:glycerate kinase
MRIVIAPDKFKGSLDAAAVAQCLAAGLHRVDSSLVIETLPMADGGEGTVDAAVSGGFVRHTTRVTGPTGHLVAADFAVRGSDAVIEIAAASGLAVLPGGIRDALGATSAGTGELIRAALDLGCRNIVLAVGGSACTDGGAGMLTGLGAILRDEAGTPLAPGGAALANLATADLTTLDVRLASCAIILASDVDNPLLGTHGAAAVFGPQKGATADNVVELDAALARFARVLSDVIGDTAHAAISAPGAGSAGGIGYGAMAVLGATRRAGIDVVAELTHLAEYITGADLVITGEGSLDRQSLLGKTPVGVAQVAARVGVSVIAVCGRTSLSEGELRSAGFSHTFALTDLESDIDVCMNDAGRLLTQVGTMIQKAHLTNTSSTKREEL